MPEQKRARRRIPAELVEEIVLNLPVKSLLRFSTVSKSWKTMILGGEFATRYRGREMMALKLYSAAGGGGKFLACPISDMAMAAVASLSLPFDIDWYTEVTCGALRCAAVGDTLCLYNPSTRAHRRLPSPRCPPPIGATIGRGTTTSSVHAYGLGYDPANRDYKIVKSHIELHGETELYSLSNDSWRVVPDSKRKIELCLATCGVRFVTRKGVFVSGALHWLVAHNAVDILTFNLTTESYGKAAMPQLPESFPQVFCCSTNRLDVCVLRGRLAVCMDYHKTFVVWTREEDGMWKKDLAIDYKRIHPLCYSYLKPFYFGDADGGVVKAVITPVDIRKLFIYKEEEDGSSSLVEKSFSGKGYGILATFTYFESLVSPFPLPH